MSIHPMDAPPPAMPYEGPGPGATGIGGTGNLEILRGHHKVLLNQQLDAIEAMTFIDRPNKYLLFTEDEKLLMKLDEESMALPYKYRAIDVIARDSTGEKLFHVTRPSKPCSLCGFCCAGMGKCKYEGDVSLYPEHLGHLEQRVSFSSARLEVEEKGGDTKYKIRGGSALCTPTQEYKILDKKDKEVGEIEKLGYGIGLGENKWKIKFPDDAQPDEKALIIGVTILIDYRFHFNARQPPRRRR